MPNNLPWVITGTPRSGTTYVADLLTRNGLHTTHERITYSSFVTLSGTGTHLQPPGESTHRAAPHVRSLRNQHTVIVHLLRPPIDTIASIVARNLLNNPGVAEAIEANVPWVLNEPTGPRRAARYWLEWNTLVEGAADLTWRLGEIGPRHVAALAALTGLTAPRYEDVPVPNPGVKRPRISADELGSNLYKEVISAANRYAIPVRVEGPMDRRTQGKEGTPQIVPVKVAKEGEKGK